MRRVTNESHIMVAEYSRSRWLYAISTRSY